MTARMIISESALVVGLLVTAACGAGSRRVAVPPTKAADTTTSTTIAVTPTTAKASPSSTTPGRTTPIARSVTASLANLNRSDPTAVGTWAAQTIWTIDTTSDTDPTDAELRAIPVFTASYAAGLRALPRPASPGAEWATWKAHGATTTASAVLQRDSGALVDTATTAHRSYFITVTFLTSDGAVIAPKTDVQFITLTKTGAVWSVASFGPTG